MKFASFRVCLYLRPSLRSGKKRYNQTARSPLGERAFGAFALDKIKLVCYDTGGKRKEINPWKSNTRAKRRVEKNECSSSKLKRKVQIFLLQDLEKKDLLLWKPNNTAKKKMDSNSKKRLAEFLSLKWMVRFNPRINPISRELPATFLTAFLLLPVNFLQIPEP